MSRIDSLSEYRVLDIMQVLIPELLLCFRSKGHTSMNKITCGFNGLELGVVLKLDYTLHGLHCPDITTQVENLAHYETTHEFLGNLF